MTRLFSLHGRSGRRSFWLTVSGCVAMLCILLAAFWVYALTIPGQYEDGGPTPFPKGPLGIVGALVWFALLAATFAALFAAAVRRLHDRAMSGWWVLVFLVAPNPLYGLGEYVAETTYDMAIPATLLRIAALALTAWGVVELGVLPGRARYSL